VNTLDRIVAATREDVARRRRSGPPVGADRAARPGTFVDALRRPGLSVIAEHKRRSPSAGVIREDTSLEDVLGAYERGGAAALSILTEEHSFGGSLADLRAARAASDLPILRKDFIVDPFQIDESIEAGADAILLIVAALDDAELRSLHDSARGRGLDALVEVHDQPELERALEAGATTIGINNRDLRTLEVDVGRTFELLPLVPDTAVTVAESGFARREQLAELEAAGVDAVLIGEALMRSEDIEAACRDLTGSV
jgi:indole-3-glycerol phosphate synthase